MKTSEIDGRFVVVTCGAKDSTGRTIAAMFATEADARSEDADDRAVAIVYLDSLPASVQAVACENTDSH